MKTRSAQSSHDILTRVGLVEDVFQLSAKELEHLSKTYLNPVAVNVMKFMGMNRSFRRAEGLFVYDEQGNSYLDFLSGFGALNLGHEPPEILAALQRFQGPNILQSALNPFAAKLAQLLAEVSPEGLTRTFFCNSGAETVEAALKLARIATGRKVLLSTQGAFHGKTFGALSVSGKEKYREPFKPVVPETEWIPYDDVEALEKRLSREDVAGFIVEPIQGENGVVLPRPGYLKSVQEICNRYGTLLLIDEIQTGMGRTGRLFCCNYEEVEPDVLILSKSLSGGIVPIGAMVTRDSLWKKAYGNLEKVFLHTSTFGGNSRACLCGFVALRMLLEKGLIQNAVRMGHQLLKSLVKLKERYSVLMDVRGKGLMIGLSFARFKGKERLAEGFLTLWAARQLLKRHRIITAFALNNLDVLRIAPPLIVTEEAVASFLDAMEDVLKSAEKFRFFRLLKR